MNTAAEITKTYASLQDGSCIPIRLAPRQIPLKGRLAGHFCSDSISAAMIKSSYDAAQRVLLNPEKFPKADFEHLDWLSEALFDLSPSAALEGI